MPSRFFQDVGAFLRGIGKKAEQASADNERINQDVNWLPNNGYTAGNLMGAVCH